MRQSVDDIDSGRSVKIAALVNCDRPCWILPTCIAGEFVQHREGLGETRPLDNQTKNDDPRCESETIALGPHVHLREQTEGKNCRWAETLFRKAAGVK